MKENEEELKDELHYDDKGDMHSLGEGRISIATVPSLMIILLEIMFSSA